MSYWKVIMSVRLSVGAFGFKGWFVRGEEPGAFLISVLNL